MTTPGMRGEVSPESMGENGIFSRRGLVSHETGPYPHFWKHLRNKGSAKALHRKAVRSIKRLGIGKSKRKFPLNCIVHLLSLIPYEEIPRKASSCRNGKSH